MGQGTGAQRGTPHACGSRQPCHSQETAYAAHYLLRSLCALHARCVLRTLCHSIHSMFTRCCGRSHNCRLSTCSTCITCAKCQILSTELVHAFDIDTYGSKFVIREKWFREVLSHSTVDP